MHIMLDHNDRFAALAIDFKNEISCALSLGNRQPSSGLIEQNEIRITCHQHANLKPLFLAMSQLGC